MSSSSEGIWREKEIESADTAQEDEKDTQGNKSSRGHVTTDADTFLEQDDGTGTDTHARGAEIRLEQPLEYGQADVEGPLEQVMLDKEMGGAIGSDEKHPSADFDIQGRRKRESVESHFPSVRNSSAFGSDDDGGGISTPAERAAAHIAERPDRSRGLSSASGISTGSRRSMPSLRRRETRLAQKDAHPWQHLGITLGLPAILLFDLVVPIIVYYTWYNRETSKWRRRCRDEFPDRNCALPKPEYDSDILGYAIICFGFGELWILVARVWRLFFRQDECAPLLSRSRWELDATSWVYAVAMILALIPFVIGAEMEMPVLYLYSPSFIMGFLGILMIITTLCPFKMPIGINSHSRGSGLRPFIYIYYAAEDFIAVDGLQDREFRVRYNERYETNKMFRQFFLYLTLWWILGVGIYIGSVSAVILTLDFHYAFGLSFGVLFAYIALWASITAVWVKIEMKREHKAYEEGAVEA